MVDTQQQYLKWKFSAHTLSKLITASVVEVCLIRMGNRDRSDVVLFFISLKLFLGEGAVGIIRACDSRCVILLLLPEIR